MKELVGEMMDAGMNEWLVDGRMDGWACDSSRHQQNNSTIVRLSTDALSSGGTH